VQARACQSIAPWGDSYPMTSPQATFVALPTCSRRCLCTPNTNTRAVDGAHAADTWVSTHWHAGVHTHVSRAQPFALPPKAELLTFCRPH
jgi:hypothetical protein